MSRYRHDVWLAMTKTAYAEGVAARRAGSHRRSNPYLRHVVRNHWFDGWDDADWEVHAGRGLDDAGRLL